MPKAQFRASRKLASDNLKKMKNRKIEIRIEKRERITFFQPPGEIRVVCALCQTPSIFIAPEHAAVSFNITMREIFRRIERGFVHFLETESGLTLVCTASLLSAINSGDFVQLDSPIKGEN
jgi:hypothetical protein